MRQASQVQAFQAKREGINILKNKPDQWGKVFFKTPTTRSLESRTQHWKRLETVKGASGCVVPQIY